MDDTVDLAPALSEVLRYGLYVLRFVDVELQDGPTKRDYLAREVEGDEKAVWWDRAVEAWPDYAKYQTKTTRQIPIFVLEPFERT